MFTSCHKNAGQNYNLLTANKSFENVANSNIWENDGNKSKLHS